MGNLETALAHEGVAGEPPHQDNLLGVPHGPPHDSSPAAKSSGYAGVKSSNPNNPSGHHQTEATSIPLSVPEVESETDVGGPSPSPQEKGPWGPFSPPGDMELICPTPYQSTSVDHGPVGGGSCNLSGSEHLASFGEAVGRALEPGMAPKKASTKHPVCPHLAAVALEREKTIPPSLLALNEIIQDSMGGPQVPGLHPNSPSTSSCWRVVPEPPRGSPVEAFVDSFLREAKKRLEEAKAESRIPPSSTRDVSEETPGASRGPEGSAGGVNASRVSEKDPGGLPGNPRDSCCRDTTRPDDLVHFCCTHFVSVKGKLGSNTSSSTIGNSGDCPLQALQQLSPRLHECSEAISRTLLLQAAPVSVPQRAPIGVSIGSLAGQGLPPFSESSLGELSTTLRRLQTSIDQFTSVLSRCEGRLLSVLHGGPSRNPPLVASLEPPGAPRGGPMEVLRLAEGEEKSSGAASSNDTTRAQQGSPPGFKDSEEEGPLTPIFFINREAATPSSEFKATQDVPGRNSVDQTPRLQGRSRAEPEDSFSPLMAGRSSRVPSRQCSGCSYGVHDGEPSGDLSEGSSGERDKTKTDKKGAGRAIRWAKDRLRGMVPRTKRQSIND